MKSVLFLMLIASVLHGADDEKRFLMLDPTALGPEQQGVGQMLRQEYVQIRKKLLAQERARGSSNGSYVPDWLSEEKDVRRALELTDQIDPDSSCMERLCRWGLKHGATPRATGCAAAGCFGCTICGSIVDIVLSVRFLPGYWSQCTSLDCLKGCGIFCGSVCCPATCAICGLMVHRTSYACAFPEIKLPEDEA